MRAAVNEPLNPAELADLRKLIAADPNGFIPVPSAVLARLIRWQARGWKSGQFVENITQITERRLHDEALAQGLVPMGDGALSDCYVTKEEKARLDQIIVLGCDFAEIEKRALATVKCELCYDTGFVYRIHDKDVPCTCGAKG